MILLVVWYDVMWLTKNNVDLPAFRIDFAVLAVDYVYL